MRAGIGVGTGENATRTLRRWALALAAMLVMSAPVPAVGIGEGKPPFEGLAGWWGGKGRLQFKDGKLEEVKCTATYFVENAGNSLRQTIRCASGSGKIEVKAQVAHSGGALTGTWLETVYNVSGDLTGEVTSKGLRVTVKGKETSLSANMDVIVRERRQLVEIQFFSDTLIGLTLVLEKG